MPRMLTRIDQYSITENDVKAALIAYFSLPPDGIWNFKNLTANPQQGQEPIKTAVYTIKESIE